MMNKHFATGLLLLTVISPAAARPLEPGWVSADARWLVHVDVDAFKSSSFGQFVLEHGEEFDIDLSDLDDFEQEIGLDPRTDLAGVTLYGLGDDPEEDAVIIAVTNERADEALAKLKGSEEIESLEIEMDGYTVHVFRDEHEQHYVHVRGADRVDRRIVLLSADEIVMLDAIKVIDGRAPGLSVGKSDILDGGAKKGSIVFVACRGIDGFQDIAPASEILRLSDGFTADIGEIDGVAYGEATVSASSLENASNITDVIKGIIALGRLVAAEEPEARPLADLVDAVDVTSRDRKITVRVSFDAKQLLWALGAVDEM
jgi:hypothetical protein